MSWIETIKTTYPKARKQHDCMAFEWIDNSGMDGVDFTFSERRAIVKAYKNRGKIEPGQLYMKQVNKLDDGTIYTFSAIPELHKICVKYNMYEI